MISEAARHLETGTDVVLGAVDERVGVLVLNRPKQRNALNPAMFEAMLRLLELFAANDQIGCVLITGAGPAFCAGGDIRGDGHTGPQVIATDAAVAESTELLRHHARTVEIIHHMPKPTLAALPGPAAGAGMSIALAADMRIAARSARLIPAWGKLAFSGDFGGAWFLTRLVGPARALQILIDDAPVDSQLGAELGLFNKVVDDAEFAEAATAWARRIANGPTDAWAAMKANVLDAERLTLHDALGRESERMVRSALTAEHRERVRELSRARSRPTVTASPTHQQPDARGASNEE